MTPERKIMAVLSFILILFSGKWIANEWRNAPEGGKGAIIGIGSALLLVVLLTALRAFGLW